VTRSNGNRQPGGNRARVPHVRPGITPVRYRFDRCGSAHRVPC